MAETRNIREEDGYTLIESLVAMAIFVTVVLLLIGSMASLMFQSRTASLERAVHFAEAEIARVDSSTAFDEEHHQGGFLLQRMVKTNTSGTVAEVTVTISLEPHANPPLVALTRVVALKKRKSVEQVHEKF